MSYLKKVLISMYMLGIVFLPIVSFAQVGDPDDPATPWPTAKTTGQPSSSPASIADHCGQTVDSPKCTLPDMMVIIGKAIDIIITSAMLILIVVVSVRMIEAQKASIVGNPDDYKKAKRNAAWGLVGIFILIFIRAGGLTAMLSYLFNDNVLQFLKLMSEAFVPHAYAQEKVLPNPSVCDDLMGCLNSILRLFMRFIVYPGLIAAWVWNGFLFIKAQGNPEELAKAKKLLIGAFVVTFIIFTIQGFLLSVEVTTKKILGGGTSNAQINRNQKSAPNTAQPGTLDQRGAPQEGAVGSSCKDPATGAFGMIGVDGKTCVSGSGRTNTASFCVGKAWGTPCAVLTNNSFGVCTNDTNGVFGCYAPNTGDTCLVSGVYGKVNDTRTECIIK